MIAPDAEPGRMTRTMRAVQPVVHPSDEPLTLRVANVREGAIHDERCFDEHVMVGTALDCDIVIEHGPLRHRLFEKTRAGFRLSPWPGLEVRTSLESASTELPAQSRGTLTDGTFRLLFHVLPKAPEMALPALPAGVEQGLWASIDWFTTVVAAFSFLLHFFAVGLVYSDWLDPIVDDDAMIVRLGETAKRVLPPPPLEEVATAPTSDAASTAPSAAASTPAGETADRRAQSRSGTSPGPASERSRGDARAAELGGALDALGMQTLTALDAAGPATDTVMHDGNVPFLALEDAAASREGTVEDDGLKWSDGRQAEKFRPGEDRGRAPMVTRQRGGDAAVAGSARPVEGPKAGVSAGGGDTSEGGKNIPGAGGVVARMRAQFRSCYRAGLDADPTLEGSTALVARVAANGSVSSVGGGGGKLAPIVPCLTAVVRGAQFAAPRDGSGVVSITVNFWRVP